MSAINTLPIPSSARFLTISLPSAPAPMTSTLAAASFRWSHQLINLNRWNRSSCADRVSSVEMRSGGCRLKSPDSWCMPFSQERPWAEMSGLSRRDLRLEPQDVAFLHPNIIQRLVIQQLLPGRAVVQLITERLTIRCIHREAQLLQQ